MARVWRWARWLVLMWCLTAASYWGYRLWRASLPNVLIIVADTLRADRLGVYGNKRGLTPFLDELARKGTTFRDAYAPSSWTCPSIASLFTSRFPSQHHVSRFESILSVDERTLAEALQDQLYTGGGFSANWRLGPDLGYGQGFANWETKIPTEDVKQRGRGLRSDVVSWLRVPLPQPLFVYVHYMEPHLPYDPPEPFRSEHGCAALHDVDLGALNRNVAQIVPDDTSTTETECLTAAYDGEVAALDSEVRALFDALEAIGFLDDAVVIFTADHGEEFKEHGGWRHGTTLFEEVVRVPLLVVAPGFGAGTVVEETVSLVDVAPTLLDILGYPSEPSFEGRSLVGAMRSARPATGEPAAVGTRPILLELLRIDGSYVQNRHTDGVVQGRSKLLRNTDGASEYYDLAEDPAEQKPRPSGAASLAQTLEAMKGDLGRRAGTPVSGPGIDAETREKLRRLGYPH